MFPYQSGLQFRPTEPEENFFSQEALQNLGVGLNWRLKISAATLVKHTVKGQL